jgi:hypothetical protein
MSLRMLDVPSGPNGGAVQLSPDPGRARNIHVTLFNIDTAAAHAAFFGRSRRELVTSGATGLPSGFCIPVPPAAAATPYAPGQANLTTLGPQPNTAVVSFLLQGWCGPLWAAAEKTGLLYVDVFDSGVIES